MVSWLSRREQRRREREQEFNEEIAKQRKEEHRRLLLTMWERIEESGADWKVKEILHMLAEKIGLEN